jgi:hypothetical protein
MIAAAERKKVRMQGRKLKSDVIRADFLSCCFGMDLRLAGIILVPLVILVRLAYHGSDACSGRAADNRSLQAVAEERAECGSARSANEGSLARTNAALIGVVAIVVSVVAAIVTPIIATIVVLPASAAVANAVVEPLIVSVVVSIPIPVLGANGKDAGEQQ